MVDSKAEGAVAFEVAEASVAEHAPAAVFPAERGHRSEVLRHSIGLRHDRRLRALVPQLPVFDQAVVAHVLAAQLVSRVLQRCRVLDREASAPVRKSGTDRVVESAQASAQVPESGIDRAAESAQERALGIVPVLALEMASRTVQVAHGCRDWGKVELVSETAWRIEGNRWGIAVRISATACHRGAKIGKTIDKTCKAIATTGRTLQ